MYTQLIDFIRIYLCFTFSKNPYQIWIMPNKCKKLGLYLANQSMFVYNGCKKFNSYLNPYLYFDEHR